MKPLLFILLFNCCTVFSQEKKTYYFDEKWKPITETLYKKIEKQENHITRFFETDTAYIGKIFLFENYGQLNNVTFKAVKEHLAGISGKAIDESKPIVINYVSDVNDPSDTGKPYIYDISNWKRVGKLKKRTDLNLFWLQHEKNKPQISRYSKSVSWIFDKDGFIARIFLEYNCPIGSIIVIKPDGTYLAYYCIERAYDDVITIIDKFSKE